MKSFLKWVETVSEPEHKKGEREMRLEELVEKRVKSMVGDLINMGKGSEKEILSAIANSSQEMMDKDDSQQGGQEQQQQNQAPQQDQMMQAPQPQGQPQMPQMPQIS